MAKVLKLVGLQSYVNPLTEEIVIKKNEAVLVSEKVAKTMLASTRANGDGEQIPYWAEAPNETPKYDFSRNEFPKPNAQRQAEKMSDEEEVEEEVAAVAATPKAVQRAAPARQRKSAAAA